MRKSKKSPILIIVNNKMYVIKPDGIHEHNMKSKKAKSLPYEKLDVANSWPDDVYNSLIKHREEGLPMAISIGDEEIFAACPSCGGDISSCRKDHN